MIEVSIGGVRASETERAYVEDVEVEDEEDAAHLQEAFDGGGPVHVDGEHRGVDLQVVQELGKAKAL